MSSRTNHWILQSFNLLGFKAAWWGCVLGAGWDLPWLGLCSMTAFIFAHYIIFKPSRQETQFIILVGLIGTGLDTIKATSGLIKYAGLYPFADWIAPLWITLLWIGFSATIGHSMAFFHKRPVIAFILGAIFGPISYMAAENFGAITFPQDEWVTITILSLVWGISMPVIYWLSHRLEVLKNLKSTFETGKYIT